MFRREHRPFDPLTVASVVGNFKSDARGIDLSVVSVARGGTWGLLEQRGALIKAQRLDGDASPFGRLSYALAFVLPANRV